MVTPGVHGARLTRAGFGGWVVALCEPGALGPSEFKRAWRVVPAPTPACCSGLPRFM